MATEYDLQNMKDRLEDYEDELEEAIRDGDENRIWHCKNNIRGLEEEIRNLEYALKH